MQSFIDRHIRILFETDAIYVMIRIDTTLISVQYRKIKIDFVMRWETNPNMVKLKKSSGRKETILCKKESITMRPQSIIRPTDFQWWSDMIK